MKAIRFIISVIAVIGACITWYYEGVSDGERGLNYWAGWQDAMIQTDYGRIPAHKSQ